MTVETVQPGDLLVNDYPVATQPVTINTGQTLTAGAVLGKVTATGKYILSASAAGDGSEVPAAVLAFDVDSTGGDVEKAVYVSGAFDASKLNFGAGIDVDATEAAFRDAGAPMYVKTLA